MASRQAELFKPLPEISRAPGWQRVEAKGAELELYENFIGPLKSEQDFECLQSEIDWQRDEIRVFGKRHLIPRMHQWYGESGSDYAWSGLKMRARPLGPRLAALRSAVEEASGTRFNSVLANLYRDGRDTMGWHADDEAELGDQPIIASLSFGATRDFVLRRKDGQGRVVLPLRAGDLFVMRGRTQELWQHALPKRIRVEEARINLTFRQVNHAKRPAPGR